MAKVYEGNLDAGGRSFAIVVSRFNELITRKLLGGALDCLQRHGADDDSIEIVWVPGAWEIPGAAQRMQAVGRFDAVICVGAVIRGGTPHFDYVAAEVAKGVAALNGTGLAPVIFGVLTTDDIEQAIERAGTKAGNKGWDAALAAIEMVDLYAQLDEES
jgi:6,7-dimethyl-8-ribityllumazine synthase